MNKPNLFLMLTFITIFVMGCKKELQTEEPPVVETKNFAQLEKAKWFLGNWENVTKESDFREIWTQKNDSVFLAKSFVTVSKDTVFNEHVELVQRNDSLLYKVTMKEQNNGQPVTFYMTTATENQVVFENPKHDFPTKITYNKITDDSLVASISGKQNGKETSESFPMKRSK